MEVLKNTSFEKRKEMLWAEMNFENDETILTHLEKKTKMLGICSNCLNNSNCVWMENKKMECEEYN